MSTLTFEAGVLRDVLNNAERIAAKSGDIVEQFGGIVLEVVDDIVVRVRSTNRDVFYDEWVNALEIEVDAADPDGIEWRLAPKVLLQIVRSLPMSSGSKITLTSSTANRLITLSCTRTKTVAQFIPLPIDNYPQWNPQDEAGLAVANDFGDKLARIEWACGSRDTDALAYLSGVRIDGKYLVATDRLKLAAIPCEMSISEVVTVPTEQLSMLTKDLGDVLVGVVDGAFVLAPTDYSQIRSTPFDKSLQQSAVDRIMSRDYEHSVKIDVAETKPVVDRVSAILGAQGHLRMRFGDEQIALEAEDYTGIERVTDAIDVAAQAVHEPVEILCNPSLFTDAISRSKSPSVTIHYDSQTVPGKPRIYVDTGDYEVWFMEIRPMTKQIGEP